MTQYFDPYARRIQELREQEQAMLNAPPQTQMYAPEEQARRATDIRRMQTLGQLGGISNDRAVMNLSEPLLKRAMEAQKPKYTEHGAFDETTGTHTYFPSYLANRRTEALGRNIQSLETASARSVDQFNRDRAAAVDKENNRRLIAALKASGSGGAPAGSLSFTGTNAENGMPIFMHNKLGPMVQDGSGRMVPYQGRIGPKNQELSSTDSKAYTTNAANSENLDVVLGQIKKNPDALGPVAVLPGWASQRVPDWLMKGGESGVNVRAGVANLTSMKIHSRTGATATVGEMDRLKDFIPNLTLDSPATIQTKLEGFRLEYDTIMREIEAGHPFASVVMKKKGQTPTKPITGLPPGQGMPPAPGAPAAPMSADDALINKYLKPAGR